MITQRLGDEFIQQLAKPRFVDTSTPEFSETLEAFVKNNVRTEQRRHGTRSEEMIRDHAIRGIVGEFAFKQIPGVEDNCPLVDDIRELDKVEMYTDQTYNGKRFQIKTRKTITAKYWTLNDSTYRSLQRACQVNDFIVVIGVHQEEQYKWLAVPFLIIDSHDMMRRIYKSSYNQWSYYYNHVGGLHDREQIVLTDLLKRDSIRQNEEEQVNG